MSRTNVEQDLAPLRIASGSSIAATMLLNGLNTTAVTLPPASSASVPEVVQGRPDQLFSNLPNPTDVSQVAVFIVSPSTFEISISKCIQEPDLNITPKGWTEDWDVAIYCDTKYGEEIGLLYDFGSIGILMIKVHSGLVLLFSEMNRFFFYVVPTQELYYIKPAFDYQGIKDAIKNNKEVVLEKQGAEIDDTPTQAPVLPTRSDLVPEGWSNQTQRLLRSHLSFDLQLWRMYGRQPIFTFKDTIGTDDLDFFRCEDKFLIYHPWSTTLYLIESPDMSQQQNWPLLNPAPQLTNLQLKVVEWHEVHGGPRRLPPNEIPDGWTQGWATGGHVAVFLESLSDGSSEPAKVLTLKPSASDEGPVRLVEENEDFYFWAERTEKIMRIGDAGGLKHILAVLRDPKRRFRDLGNV